MDGGGGGGSGYSPGGGAPAKRLYNNLDGGNPGTVGSGVGDGGDCRVRISAPILMSKGSTERELHGGISSITNMINGGSGEVSAEIEYDGGDGGTGFRTGTRYGASEYRGLLPAPFPVFPGSGMILTGLSRPFEWSPLDTGYFSQDNDDFIFRLLRSSNLSDPVQEFNVTGLDTFLEDTVDDGRYFWTVKPVKGTAVTSWMEPQEFTLDRIPPEVISGPDEMWVPSSSPNTIVCYREELSGLDPESIMYRYSFEGDNFCNWTPTDFIEAGNSRYDVRVILPEEEGNYSIQVKASDNAGNGPILAGPYDIGVDGTPPSISNISPEGWTNGAFYLSFDSRDELSGLNGNFSILIDGPEGRSELLLEVEGSTGVGFTSRDPVELDEGNYSLRIRTGDEAGNYGQSNPVEVLVDRSSPYLLYFSPPNGSVSNDSRIAPSIKILDNLSGPDILDFSMNGPSGPFERSYNNIEDSIEISTGSELEEGLHTWYANVSDLVGNRLNAGPFSFTIDREAPSLGIESVDADKGSMVVAYSDLLSGPCRVDIRCEVPDLDGFKEMWVSSIPAGSENLESVLEIELEEKLMDPVCYISARATDLGGNTGQWSERKRVNGEGSMMDSMIDYEEILGSDRIMTVSIQAPSGVDPGSVKMKIFHSSGIPVILEPIRIEVMGNSSLVEGSDLLFPSHLEMDFRIISEDIRLDFSIVYEDAFPLPEKRTWGPKEVIIDTEAPSIRLEGNPFYTEVPAKVEIIVEDKISPFPFLEVSVDDGEYSGFDGSGAPSLHFESGGIWMMINLTYGPATRIEVRATDEAGNSDSASIVTRATRAPVASIQKSFSGVLEAGEDYMVSADCQDPEGDLLINTWYLDGILSGTGENFAFSLENGTHTIILNCSDGDLFSVERLVVVVEGEKEEDITREEDSGIGSTLIWMVAIIVIVIILGSLAVILLMKRRRDIEGPDDDDETDWDESVDPKSGRIGGNAEISGSGSSNCDICFRRIPEPSRIEKCRCGAIFHRSCALKEGECPECGREIMISTT
jgi:hypothetical protein